MEIDFCWCNDDSDDPSPRDSPANLAIDPTPNVVSSKPLGMAAAVEVPRRRNPFESPRSQQMSRSPGGVHAGSGARSRPTSQSAPSPRRSGSGFFSPLLNFFTGGAVQPKSQTPPANRRSLRRPPPLFQDNDFHSPRSSPSKGGPRTPLGNSSPRLHRGGGSPRTPRSNGSPRTPRSGGSPRTPRGDGSPRTLRGDSSPRTPQDDGSPRIPRGDATPRTPRSRADAAIRQELFRPDNRARIKNWLDGSLRIAQLRRPEGEAMVLNSLGLHVVHHQCGSGLFICAISRVIGDSPADKTQQLFVGDALVEVNGRFVAHLDLDKIIMIIASAGKTVTLKVTTIEALASALDRLVESYLEERAATLAKECPSPQGPVYSGKFWDGAPEKTQTCNLKNVDGKAEDDSNEASSLTTNGNEFKHSMGVENSPLKLSTTARDTLDGHSQAQSAIPEVALTKSVDSVSLSHVDDVTCSSSAVRTSDMAVTPATAGNEVKPDTDTQNSDKKTDKEYGFYVKLPPRGGRRQIISSSTIDSPSKRDAKVETNSSKIEPQQPIIDERRVSRDIVKMPQRATKSSKKLVLPHETFGGPALTKSPTPPSVKSPVPAGLLSPDDIDCELLSSPILSLSEQVRVATLDQCSKVGAFLIASGLSEYVDLFEEQEIDYDVLGTLTESDLEKIGMEKLGARRKLLRAIRQIEPGSEYSSEISYRSSISGPVMPFGDISGKNSDVMLKSPDPPSDTYM